MPRGRRRGGSGHVTPMTAEQEQQAEAGYYRDKALRDSYKREQQYMSDTASATAYGSGSSYIPGTEDAAAKAKARRAEQTDRVQRIYGVKK